VLILLFYARGARAFQPSSLEELKTAVDNCLEKKDDFGAIYEVSGADCDTGGQAIADWDTSLVTSMYELFDQRAVFDADISGWDTSSVKDMARMFNGAKAFNQDISDWNTASVENMESMFRSATAFNQDISGSEVRSIHWSPYDRVGVVNAVP
jgi:surface protein